MKSKAGFSKHKVNLLMIEMENNYKNFSYQKIIGQIN